AEDRAGGGHGGRLATDLSGNVLPGRRSPRYLPGMRRRFRDLHAEGTFVMPNPWDVGSARLLASLGFPALATTSSGHAASLGRADQHVTLDELVVHAAALVAAVDVPLNVDAEHCFADIVETVERIAGTGAAGLSIEDFDPAARAVEPAGVAAERVGVAAEAAHRHGLLLTARAENHLYGVDDLDDTVDRLRAYRDAGADVVYAPGLRRLDDIARVVGLGVPVNVLAMPGGPAVAELASVGVRRVSTGGSLARAAYDELRRAATELLT
ncbi:MAG: 2-methylisocitrate lyase, partial [Acidimicrobiales bacterium]|nr:2-methylisocitrate lyase [Acidimicrobiales bacterium]